MKQVLQDRSTGRIIVAEVAEPTRPPGYVMVEVHASVISAGTETAVASSTQQSLIGRVAAKPELIRKGFTMWREHGLQALLARIESKYSGYEVLGYSCAGTVLEADLADFPVPPGTRVSCGGVGYAMHAEKVVVPPLLCAKIPEGVDDETAAYATLGAIAMQGVRQAGVQLGEYVAVIGLGLIGLLTVQILRAAGCRVLGIDPAEAARLRGSMNGCERVATPDDAHSACAALTRGVGADAVIICASAKDSGPVALAGELARSRGRIVMIGATGIEIPRELYFRKELSFILSRSYGPGRYDPTYEESGIDYPIDYVRFTEQRNLIAFLELAATGKISVQHITTHRFPLENAPEAYNLLKAPVDRAGIVLTYPAPQTKNRSPRRIVSVSPPITPPCESPGISIIGAGEYATNVILPLLREHKSVVLRGVAARRPDHAAAVAKRFGFSFHTADAEAILEDGETQIVFIATRHDTHAEFAARALEAGKHVWVEKPLCIDRKGLETVLSALPKAKGLLAVGFNRRFSPLTDDLLALRRKAGPIMALARVNAGKLPPDHWTQNPAVGGGRLIGEGCHFLDYLAFLAGARPARVQTFSLLTDRIDLPPRSNFAVTVTFADGSLGQLFYSADGPPCMPKERIEFFGAQTSAVVDDFRSVTIFSRRAESRSLPAQDKGQAAMLAAFLKGVSGKGEFPMTTESIISTTLLTLAAQESLDSGRPIDVL